MRHGCRYYRLLDYHGTVRVGHDAQCGTTTAHTITMCENASCTRPWISTYHSSALHWANLEANSTHTSLSSLIPPKPQAKAQAVPAHRTIPDQAPAGHHV